jgi:hypothetical protein
MKRKIENLCLAVIFLVLIAACGSQPSSPIVGSSTPPATIPTFVDAETLVAHPDYMVDCRSKYPQISQSQVGYKDIYPGTTTKESLQKMLGSPSKKIQLLESETEWLYDSSLALFLEQDRVAEIFIFNDLLKPLQNYLILYGCPDVMFVIDTNQHPSGNYDTLLLVYHSIGLTLMFDKFPVQNTDTPIQASFFSAGTLDDFLARKQFLEDSTKAKPIFWLEAIK